MTEYELDMACYRNPLFQVGRIDMDSNYDVIQGDCPNCPFGDLFGGFCFYYRFYPANIGYGEATCRCEKLKQK